MRLIGIRGGALIAAAILVIGIGSALARASGGDTIGVVSPNASCTSVNPCLQEDNKSTGSGLTGTSKKGTGIVGATSFLSTGNSNAKAGVLGQDLNLSDTFNAGVEGISKKGFGVLGVSTNGTAVSGTSTNGTGVLGASTNSIGVLGNGFAGGVFGSGGSTGFGLEGFGFEGVIGANTADPSSDALLAIGFGGNLIHAKNSHNVDVLTLDDTGFLDTVTVFGEKGVIGVCSTLCTSGSSGVQGTTNVPGTFGVLGTSNDPNAVGVLAIGGGGDIIQGDSAGPGGNTVFRVGSLGDVMISGRIFTAGQCNLGCSRTRRVESYVPHESAPMSEDVGEAQLVDGRAYVRFDSAFANVIDHTANYSVFITPEGDNRGLYVTNKSLGGFEVRESQGGRSTLAFSYRIVAKPFGEYGARLPIVKIMSHPRPTFVRPHASTRSAPKMPGIPKP